MFQIYLTFTSYLVHWGQVWCLIILYSCLGFACEICFYHLYVYLWLFCFGCSFLPLYNSLRLLNICRLVDSSLSHRQNNWPKISNIEWADFNLYGNGWSKYSRGRYSLIRGHLHKETEKSNEWGHFLSYFLSITLSR